MELQTMILPDQYEKINKISCIIVPILTAISLASIIFIILAINQAIRHKRKFRGFRPRQIASILMAIILSGTLWLSIYFLPNFLNIDSWKIIQQQFPASFMYCIYIFITAIAIYLVYFIISYLFPLANGYSYFFIVSMSLISGCSYTFVTFIVNTVLAFENKANVYMIYYFFASLMLYVITLKFVKMQLITVTNNYIYSKRMEIVEKLLKAQYENIEKMGKENIYTCINNDTETVSSSIGIIVSGMTSMVIIICCLIYLALADIKILLLSAIASCFIFLIIMVISKSSKEHWEQCRSSQNAFFKHIEDLLYGLKELHLKSEKRRDFNKDLGESCIAYKNIRTRAELVFAYIAFANEILAFSFIAGLIFVLPSAFPQFQLSTIREFIIIFIMLKGHYDIVLNAIPKLSQVKVSWRRINQLIYDVSILKTNVDKENIDRNKDIEISIQLSGVEYGYKNDENNSFTVGPIDCEFKSGEITFITGGNGSGKSTLAKLITGLYVPDKGKILVNGQKASMRELSEYFSAIFSDYYLFSKLYGINQEQKSDEMNRYLNLLKIDSKISVKNGEFSTIRLSTGQRKRLALLLSYLEDSPVYLFDEWAADQDPEFRKYFYLTLLPQMRAKGKCIIAITHDDRYFSSADKVIKMEMGNIVSASFN